MKFQMTTKFKLKLEIENLKKELDEKDKIIKNYEIKLIKQNENKI